MTDILVEDHDCSSYEIVEVLTTRALPPTMEKRWRDLATGLRETHQQIEIFRLGILQRKYEPKHAVEQLITRWRLRCASSATLNNLIEVISEIQGCKKHAIALFQHFRPLILQRTAWCNLNSLMQSYILDQPVLFLGESLTIREIASDLETTTLHKILGKFCDEIKLWDASLEVTLSQSSIPICIPYYTKRTLTSRRYVDPRIFKSPSQDVFCLQGMALSDLYYLAGSESSDRSGILIRDKNLSVRFILLELEQHFITLSSKSKQSLHWIIHENGKFKWIRTHGSNSLIQRFLERKRYDEFNDNEILNMSNFNNLKTHVCIVDSPGMGKTILLANIATQVKMQLKDSGIVLYCRAADIFNEVIADSNPENFESTIFRSICHQVSIGSKLGEEILYEVLTTTSRQIHLFLDGVDEVKQEIMHTMEMIRRLRTVRNIHLYVTSRPHLKTEIEEAMSQLCYNILPLTEETQVKLLVEFWKQQHNIRTSDSKLNEFAKSVISTINTKMSGGDIGGIPLHSVMLADVYADNAEKFSNDNVSKFDSTVDVFTVFKMYEIFVLQKFERILPQDRPLIRYFHAQLAHDYIFGNKDINYFFPRIIETSEVILWDKIFDLGIIEKSEEKVRFVHDTFAEYVLSDYVAGRIFSAEESSTWLKYLIRYIANDTTIIADVSIDSQLDKISHFISNQQGYSVKINDWKPMANALGISDESFSDVISQIQYPEITFTSVMLKVWKETLSDITTLKDLVSTLRLSGFSSLSDALTKRFGEARLKNPSFWYFMDTHLAEHNDTIIHSIEMSDLESNDCESHVDDQFYQILSICTNYGYCNLSEVMTTLFLPECIKTQIKYDEYIWDKVLATAAANCSIQYIDYLYQLRYKMGHSPSPKITEKLRVKLLQSACRSGNIQNVAKLLQNDKSIPKRSGLLNACIVESRNHPDWVINTKEQIIILLLKTDPTILNEKNPDDLTPLFSAGKHLNLIKLLIKHKADLKITLENSGDTFLHAALISNDISKDDFCELVNFILKLGSSDDSIFSIKNKSGHHIASLALNYFDFDVDTLNSLCSGLYFDLNEYDNLGRTILHVAVASGRKDSIIKVIVNQGGCWGKRTLHDNASVAHLAVAGGNMKTLRALIILGVDINVVDKYKCTPLHWAVCDDKNLFLSQDIIQVLLDNGANVNALDKRGYTPLRYVQSSLECADATERQTEDMQKRIEVASLLKNHGAQTYFNDKCRIV